MCKDNHSSCQTTKAMKVYSICSLIDGEFKGAIGQWKIGPHDIDDVALLMSEDEIPERKEEIIQEIRSEYHPEITRILKFNGKTLVESHP